MHQQESMQRFAVALAILVITSLWGCVGKMPLVTECGLMVHGGRAGPALVGVEYGRQFTPIPLNSVQFSDWSAVRSLAVQRLFASRTPTSTVQVTARFVSCLDQPTALLVRTSFLDESQAPSEPTSAWKTVLLEPRLTSVYSETSTSTDVANYLIEIMPSR